MKSGSSRTGRSLDNAFILKLRSSVNKITSRISFFGSFSVKNLNETRLDQGRLTKKIFFAFL